MTTGGYSFCIYPQRAVRMKYAWKAIPTLTLPVVLILLAGNVVVAQQDSTRKNGIDSFLLNQKGIIGQLAENLLADTSQPDENDELERNDAPYQRYRNRVIRNIYIGTLDFGVSIRDTSKRLNNGLTRLSNNLHRKSRDYVIRNNLFFKEKQRLSPYLLGDNERHLRDLSFLQDARITVRPVPGTRDSVDIVVYTKDVFSIGGTIRVNNMQSAQVAVKEDNVFGWGDKIQVSMLYDQKRNEQFGHGVEYVKRNIAGSFIDAYAGYLNFSKSFSSGQREDNMAYLMFVRPLVNPYMKWTYSVETSVHSTRNMYATDSLYDIDLKYQYTIVDAWAGLNMSAEHIGGKNDDDRLRRLLAVRVLNQDFTDKPLKYAEQYDYRYADLFAVLVSASIFKQNFYKTQYIYGFGRNEDVPEGIDISLTAGWTRKNLRERPYVGLDFQRFYFSSSERYFNYTARVGSFFYKGKAEDIDLLANLSYFDRLRHMGPRWKQRTFLSAGFGKQCNTLLNEPLMLESEFGLPGFRYNNLGGDIRVSAKAESVFFSPWSIVLFKFAPFVFADATLFRLYNGDNSKKIYSAVGGGIRTRNESLIFGTVELKAMYFPRKNFFNDTYRIEFNTNLRFKYNRQFIKKPDFVHVNY